MKRIFTLSFSFAVLFSHAQTNAVLDINNAHASVNVNSVLFNNALDAGFEVPAVGEVHSIFASRLWIGGISPDQQLKLAAGTYGPVTDGTSDFFPGPLTTDGAASTTEEMMEGFNRVWKVNQSDVQIHKAYFDALANGTAEEEFPDGYEIPDYFFDWPAHGDIAQDFAYYLAPFCDYDLDGVYNPQNGDAPLICGDQAIYFIMNDKGNIHSESQGQPIGVEIHVMVYGFTSEESFLNNTVFVQYKIINRGTQTLNEAITSIWTDTDIGNATDDYIGTHVQLGAVYGYNGDALDEPSSSSTGYGEQTPMQAVQILAGPMLDADNADNMFPGDISVFETNSYGPFGFGYEDDILDNERLGLTNSMYFNNSGNDINGAPSSPLGYYNYMNSIYLNGEVLNIGDSISSSYIYFGESDVWNTGSESDLPFWSEVTEGNPPSDRRIIASSGHFTLEPGETNLLDVAYVYADETGTGMSEFEWMEHELEAVKNFFDEHLVNCPEAGFFLSADEIDANMGSLIHALPNPNNGNFSLAIPAGISNASLVVYDITGNEVHHQSLHGGINDVALEEVAAGIYSAVVISKHSRGVVRVVLQ